MQNPQNSSAAAPGGTDTASSTAFRAKTEAPGMARAAVDKIDENRAGAAGGIESAASTLHQKADNLPGGESVKGAAHAAADASNSTADYVRENGVKSMLADVQKIVKNNPGPALLTAAVLGFLVARTFSRE
jgi:hypothetical protein